MFGKICKMTVRLENKLFEVHILNLFVKAVRNASVSSVLKLNRNGATILATYDPIGGGVNAAQNVDAWTCQALTVCGFRQWVEHYQVILQYSFVVSENN